MKNVGEYIGQYRIVSQQTQTLAYQFYRVESTIEVENMFVLKTWPEMSIFSQMGIDTFTQQAQALVDFHAPFFSRAKGMGLMTILTPTCFSLTKPAPWRHWRNAWKGLLPSRFRWRRRQLFSRR